MGVVYQAEDLDLKRSVALKFLPEDLVHDSTQKDQFLREARTASALDHPNIGVIHGIEQTSDGRTFIVMAYYDGETVAHKLFSGPLPVEQATNIAIKMAHALAEAHARTIVHRDIKPSNLIVTHQNVIKIVELDPAAAVQRELLLVKVRADTTVRSQVLETVALFRAKVVDVCPEALTIEATGTADKLDALLRMLEPCGIREIAQSGMVALGRGARAITAGSLR